jgi:hypothetical protein
MSSLIIQLTNVISQLTNEDSIKNAVLLTIQDLQKEGKLKVNK